MYSVLPETKLMKQAKKTTLICDCLEQIKDDYVNGIDISYSELVFLYEHQDIIKKIYTDDPTLWELAGIDESEWTNRHNKGSK